MNGQYPVAESPFSARCLMMSANHSAVDHLQRVRHGPALVQRVHDLLQKPRKRPSSELSVDAGPLSEFLRQVPPRCASPCDPENPIKNETMVVWIASMLGADRLNVVIKEPPFLVRHQVSCQASLHNGNHLGSCRQDGVNHFCQHCLGV